jgi:hypothetical protein
MEARGKGKDTGGLESALRARITDVEKKTEQMLDLQQREALERAVKRKAEQVFTLQSKPCVGFRLNHV